MIFGSVCSGIEAASQAWEPLGFRAAFLSDIDKFSRSLLSYYYPEVPLHGDFTTIESGMYEPIDVLVGGTPCQSFSAAGKRKGMEDARGNLALEFVKLSERLLPRWIVWENVPGVLSSSGGRDFGSVIGALAQLGYGLAWRICNAKFFGVPQSRRRVFLVGYLGDTGERASQVLFDSEGVCRHSHPSNTPREETAKCLTARDGAGRNDPFLQTYLPIAKTLTTYSGGNHVDDNYVPIAFSCKDYGGDAGLVSPTLRAMNNDTSSMNGGGQVAVLQQVIAFAQNQFGDVVTNEAMHCITTNGNGTGRGSPNVLTHEMAVRRLMPMECERLQGFKDNWTLIPYGRGEASDSVRFKAIGNSMAVPVMRWIGKRLLEVDRSY